MLHVYPLKDTDKKIFEDLFKDYYAELDCADDAAHLADEYVIPDMIAGLLRVDLIADDGKVCGFVIYQIDDIDNEWNFKEGWGDIREIYISPEMRGRGLGKFLLYTAEMKLKEAGVDKAYCLPYEAAESFFTACGYAKTEEYSDGLDCFVYEKVGLRNGCSSDNK